MEINTYNVHLCESDRLSEHSYGLWTISYFNNLWIAKKNARVLKHTRLEGLLHLMRLADV